MQTEQPCDSCGGTGKQDSDGMRAALDMAAEQRKSLGCRTLIGPVSLSKIVRSAIMEFARVTEEQALTALPLVRTEEEVRKDRLRVTTGIVRSMTEG